MPTIIGLGSRASPNMNEAQRTRSKARCHVLESMTKAQLAFSRLEPLPITRESIVDAADMSLAVRAKRLLQ
jgi:hypothetical protein